MRNMTIALAGLALGLAAAGSGHAHLLGGAIHLTGNGPTATQVEADYGSATVDGTFEFTGLVAGSLGVSVTDTQIIFQNESFEDGLTFLYSPGVFNGFELSFTGLSRPIVGASPDSSSSPFGVLSPVTTSGDDVFVDLSAVSLQPGGEAIVGVTTLPPTAPVPEAAA